MATTIVLCSPCGKRVCLHCHDLHRNTGCEVIQVLGIATMGAAGPEVEEPIHELREVATSCPHEALCIADDLEGVEVEYTVTQGETVRTVHLHARETETMLSLTNDPLTIARPFAGLVPHRSGTLGASHQ